MLAQETLREQQRVNADQLELNKLARERFERRYASPVSWWIDKGDESIAHYVQGNAARIDDAGPDDVVSLEVIHVQNRAPVPVHDPAFVLPPIDAQTPWWLLADIPPCTIVTYDLEVIGNEGRSHAGLAALIEIEGWRYLAMRDGRRCVKPCPTGGASWHRQPLINAGRAG
ncbi:hypothetical protein ACLQ24_24545 [Micromonospora sp. DT4]|uniref:hypothetical protein n=1 Tax=Micromonospora sp. DT4 TaxID=3393438 RepID=UPI003CEDE8FE